MPEGDARNFHKTLWRKVMNRIHQGMAYKDFDIPAGIEQVAICSETGLLPREGCPVTEEYFDIGTMPTDYCDQHFYEYEEEQEMEIYDEEQLTPAPENPGDGTGDGTGGDGTGGGTGDGTGDGTGGGTGDGTGDGTGGGTGDGTDGGDIESGDDIYYY